MTLKHVEIPIYLQKGREASWRVRPNLRDSEELLTENIASLIDNAKKKIEKAKRLLAP
jgi:hypothetical protein